MISVLILTKNEALDLPGALASVAWSDDIHILDSHSTDDTIAIATAAGAHVHQHPFDDFATQRNFGLQLPFSNPWLLILDADERPTPELSAEMNHVVQTASPTAAFRLRRRDFLFDTWLKHAQMSPFYIRLVRPECVRYVRSVNETLEVTGIIGYLLHPLDHFPFSKSITHWLTRHNQYSSMEAQLIVAQQGVTKPNLHTALRDPNFHTRRLHQKAIFYTLPGRPLIKLGYMLFLRGAIFDGYPGITYAMLTSIYEYLIVLKTRELRLNARQPRSQKL